MIFNVKKENEADKMMEFTELGELIAFIMGCNSPVVIKPNWSSKIWELIVEKK